MSGLIVDLFAGGGGASQGIEAATGRTVDIAIDHSATALAVHKANHPKTLHLTADIWEVDPKIAAAGRQVDILWALPDCTHFSVAKGGKPRKQGIRSLAWVVVDWAKAVRPRIIFLENVSEFRGWGPLTAEGKPDKARMGETFREWKAGLEQLGYVVDYRVLDASHYGAPTRRRRLFLVARCDGQQITWPVPTHGPGLLPYRTAAECIDWSLPCPSIFDRKKPLAEKTLWRIAQGIRRFVLESASPFILKVNHGDDGKTGDRFYGIDQPLTTVTASGRGHALVTPTIIGCGGRAGQSNPTGMDEALGTITAKNDRCLIATTMVQTSYGERPGQRPRYLDLHQPLGTVVAQGQKHALVSAFLAKHYGGVVGVPFDGRPLDTITAQDHHAAVTAEFGTPGGGRTAEVRALLAVYYGQDSGQALTEPLRTITAKHRMGLVTVAGVDYQIVDIGMRMLEPHELLRAQFGEFASAYDLSAATTKAAQVRLIGNSVCPEVARAVVAANLPSQGESRRAA